MNSTTKANTQAALLETAHQLVKDLEASIASTRDYIGKADANAGLNASAAAVNANISNTAAGGALHAEQSLGALRDIFEAIKSINRIPVQS